MANNKKNVICNLLYNSFIELPGSKSCEIGNDRAWGLNRSKKSNTL